MFSHLLAFLDARADYAPARRVCLPGLWSMGVAGKCDMSTGTIIIYLGLCSYCYTDPVEDVVMWTVAHEHRHLQQLASGGSLPVPRTDWNKSSAEDFERHHSHPAELDADAFAARMRELYPESLRKEVRDEIRLLLENSPAWLVEHREKRWIAEKR